jgi:hypothetical protein
MSCHWNVECETYFVFVNFISTTRTRLTIGNGLKWLATYIIFNMKSPQNPWLMHVKLTSSSWRFFTLWGGLPWGTDWNDWPHASYSTLRDQRAVDWLLIFNPLMPVARPSKKGNPPWHPQTRPPQGPWICW